VIARVAELVDALDSKSGFLMEVGVRFPSRAPYLVLAVKHLKISVESEIWKMKVFLMGIIKSGLEFTCYQFYQ
tara:strand:- start:3 stop:221 length:219 start_codon:yes stop_codon:yes gene_type:complete